MKKPACYKHLAPSGARSDIGCRVYKQLVPNGTKSVSRRHSRIRFCSKAIIRRLSIQSYLQCVFERFGWRGWEPGDPLPIGPLIDGDAFPDASSEGGCDQQNQHGGVDEIIE